MALFHIFLSFLLDTSTPFIHQKYFFCFSPICLFLFSSFKPMPDDPRYPRHPNHHEHRHKKRHHRSFSYARKMLNRRGFEFPQNYKLGKGRYSKVYKVFDNGVGQHFAARITDLDNVSDSYKRKFVPRELNIWRALDHPNIVRLHKDFINHGYLFEIIELSDGGDLLNYLRDHGRVEEMTCRGWMLQIIDGLSYLHQNRIVHRDLKPENVLLFEGGIIKISDYGFAKKCREVGDLSSTFCGTKAYKAPEVLQQNDYDPFKSDVWSFGVLCFVMLADRLPFYRGMSKRQMVEDQRNGEYQFPSELIISAECRRTINAILTFDPDERPNISEVRNLPWFASDDGSGSSSQS